MLKAVFNYFWPETKSDLNLDDAYAILNHNEETTQEEDNPQELLETHNLCSYKRGIITKIENDIYYIDDKYEFQTELEGLKEGTKVSYIIHSDKGPKAYTISNLSIIDNLWDERIGNDEEKTWCHRTLVSKIVSRDGRKLVCEPGNCTIDLDNVSTEFVPTLGDWVELDLKCTIDEQVSDLFGTILEINKVNPLRSNVLKGKISQFYSKTQTGIINKNIYFNTEVLPLSYMPIVGDDVICEVIESEQENCTWRAIKVIPNNEQHLPVLDKTIKTDEVPDSWDAHRQEVYITEDLILSFSDFNQQEQCDISIENQFSADLFLKKLIFNNINCQIRLLNPRFIRNFRIKPKEPFIMKISCIAKSVGCTKELLLFKFENFTIGRYITINFNPPGKDHKGSRYQSKDIQHNRQQFLDPKSKIFRGQRLTNPPRFMNNRIAEYPIPSKLFEFFNELPNYAITKTDIIGSKLIQLKPVLEKPLSYQIYEEVFHTLIFIEEIFVKISMRMYDQDRACFIKNGEYLMLEIENLAEKRPSVIQGDKIFAKDPSGQSSVVFEGFVHKIGSKHVYVKFSNLLHESYNGEDYSITIEHTRTHFKRMHNAIKLVLRSLGREVLFPTKVIVKDPQVIFDYDQYSDVIEVNQQNDEGDDNIKSVANSIHGENENLENITSNGESSSVNSASWQDHDELRKLDTESIVVENINEEIISSNKEASCDKDSPPKEYNRSQKPDTESIHGEKKNIEIMTCNTESTSDADSSSQKRNKRLSLKEIKNFKTDSTNKLKLEWFDSRLNYFQKEAVRNILLGVARPLPYIIFGPPGTGKTVTIVETILQIVKMIPSSRLLVCAPSNSAADLIALHLIHSEVLKPGDIVRLLSYTSLLNDSVPLELIPYSACSTIHRWNLVPDEEMFLDNGMKLGVSSKSIGRHKITVCTCSVASTFYSMGIPGGHFTHFIIDEAGQAIEPDIMVPLSIADSSASQIILAGDPMQLDPVVLSAARYYGLSESYLGRLLSRFPYIRDIEGFPKSCGYDPRLVTRLVYNYRSLPEILMLPNKMFYNSDLRATVSETDSEEAKLLLNIKEILPQMRRKLPPSVVFHGVVGENFQMSDSPSWFNPKEVAQVFYYVNEFYRLGVQASDIAIITPYTKQAKQIKEVLKEAEFDLPRIGTVEDMQGQESKIVILSTVRSTQNHVGKDVVRGLGFVHHPKRINVALTRAQVLNIIIGNPMVLTLDTCWRTVINFCLANGSYRGCEYCEPT